MSEIDFFGPLSQPEGAFLDTLWGRSSRPTSCCIIWVAVAISIDLVRYQQWRGEKVRPERALVRLSSITFRQF